MIKKTYLISNSYKKFPKKSTYKENQLQKNQIDNLNQIKVFQQNKIKFAIIKNLKILKRN